MDAFAPQNFKKRSFSASALCAIPTVASFKDRVLPDEADRCLDSQSSGKYDEPGKRSESCPDGWMVAESVSQVCLATLKGAIDPAFKFWHETDQTNRSGD